jgi:hypothetical protein
MLKNSNQKKIIALDCDGVLLSYQQSYEIVWERAFGEKLSVIKANAYHANNMYGVEFKSESEKNKFFSFFTADVWESMPALPMAKEACDRLVHAGYELVCVTAMPQEYLLQREINLKKLQFPIHRVIATGRSGLGFTKTKSLHEIMPIAFVDDLATNFIDLNPLIHRAFIQTDAEDAPDPQLSLTLPASTHVSLDQFVDFWLK